MDNDLTPDELKTLALFDSPDQLLNIDPQHLPNCFRWH